MKKKKKTGRSEYVYRVVVDKFLEKLRGAIDRMEQDDAERFVWFG